MLCLSCTQTNAIRNWEQGGGAKTFPQDGGAPFVGTVASQYGTSGVLPKEARGPLLWQQLRPWAPPRTRTYTHTHTHTVSRDQLRVTHWHNQSVDIASIDSPQKTPSVDLPLMCHTCFCLSILLHSSVSLFLLSASSLTFKSISIFFLRFHPVLLSLSLSPPSFFSFLSPFEENTTNNQTPLTPSPQEFSDPSP